MTSAHLPASDGAAPSEEEQRAAVLQGLAVVQQSSATWTRAQLMRAIGSALPAAGAARRRRWSCWSG